MHRLQDHPELITVLNEFIKRLKPILDENLLAVYLQGSFALGGADKDSDVDFIVVVENDIPNALLPGLQAMHGSLFEIPSYWSHHMEGSYFPKHLLKTEDPDHTPIVYIDNGSKTLERSTHDNTLVVRWVTREHGITLYGPAPEYYIDPVSGDALKSEVKDTMQEWGGEILSGEYVIQNVWQQAFAVNLYCRMLHTLTTGKIYSKPDAVSWAQATLDRKWHDLIQAAWQKRPNQYLYASPPANPDEVARTIEFIRYALKLANADS